MVSISQVDLHDAFLLSAAAKAGYAGAIEVLLSKLRFGPSTFALSRALTAAAQNGRARAVATLLRAGAPAAAYNHAALEAAAQGGNPEVREGAWAEAVGAGHATHAARMPFWAGPSDALALCKPQLA